MRIAKLKVGRVGGWAGISGISIDRTTVKTAIVGRAARTSRNAAYGLKKSGSSRTPSITILRPLTPGLLLLMLLWQAQAGFAAGECSAPGISNDFVDTTNGGWTAHINDGNDKVEMNAGAEDYDTECDYGCQDGNRIDSAGISWNVSSGFLDYDKGTSNAWKAGTSIGHKTLTVTFPDKDDGVDCDDDDTQVQKTLTAFKVAVRLSTSDGNLYTWWEDDSSGNTGFGGNFDLSHILTSSPNPAVDGDSTTATWTLQTSPANTPMKGDIRAKIGAKSYNGLVDGVTTDDDWNDDGSTLMSISLSAGFVSMSVSRRMVGPLKP